MKSLPPYPPRRSGFTLLELLIGMSIAAAMFAVVLSAGSFLLKSLYVANDYSNESNEELRAMDFLARDIRGALSFSIPTGGNTLTITLPDYYTSYDAQGNPTGTPRDPVITSAVVDYGDKTKPLVVTYFVSGTNLVRRQTVQATNTTTDLLVCSNVNAMELAFVAMSTSVNYSITFQPKHQAVSAALRAGTKLTGTVSARSMRFNTP